ncbi:MAG: hypothetical protein WA624_00985, partial [Methylocella sp.]
MTNGRAEKEQGLTGAASYSAKNEATAKAKGVERATGPSLGRTILAIEPTRCLFNCRRIATLLFLTAWQTQLYACPR